MSIRGLQSVTIREFGGAWTYPDPADVPVTRATLARNVAFQPGQVKTAPGFQPALAWSHPITSMFHWQGPNGNLLVAYSPDAHAVRHLNIAAPSLDTLIPGIAANAKVAHFVNAGARLYATYCDNNGQGAHRAQVVSNQSGLVADSCFPPPLTVTFGSYSEPSAGEITAGEHLIGYRLQHRSGFFGRLCPVSGAEDTFTPRSITASGGMSARITLTAAWPVDAIKVHLVMTTKQNKARFYYVPGAVKDVVGGSVSTVTFDWSISDGDLAAADQAEEVTFAQLLWTTKVNGQLPFVPSMAFTHGDRMVWIARIDDGLGNMESAAIISRRNAFQEFTYDLNVKQLPGKVDFVTGCSLPGAIYFFGPNGTHSTHDTGSDPVQWPAPRLVDGQRGALGIHCVDPNPAGGFAWVADRAGLFWFNGAYSGLPVSENQTDQWQRINWDAAQRIIVKDSPVERKVYVLVPLDGAEAPTHIFMWDYSGGYGYRDVVFSVRDFLGLSPGALALVQNTLPTASEQTRQRLEVWIGPGGDVNLVNDPSMERASEWDAGPNWEIVNDGLARTGSYAAKRTANGVTTSITASGTQIPVHPGHSYRAEVYGRAYGGANGSLVLGLRWYSASGAELSTSSASLAAASAGSYTRVTVHAVAPLDAAYARPYLEAASHTSGVWYADDIAVRSMDVMRETVDGEEFHWRDGVWPVTPEYQTAVLPGEGDSNVVRHHAMVCRVMGEGHARAHAISIDARIVKPLRAVELALEPGIKHRRDFFIEAESVTYRWSTNLLEDYGFECTPSRWILGNGWVRSSTTVHEGKYSLAQPYSPLPGFAISPSMDIAGGASYALSVWQKNTSAATGTILVELVWYDSNDVELYSTPLYSTHTSDWLRSGVIGVAPNNAVYARVRLSVTGGKTYGTHYLDDLAVVKRDSHLALSSIQHWFAPGISAR